ncbi:MAG: hypothetical protein JJU29_06620 [Verrucomicrobia bacterium]|nr:hypothetical protein [Verrucomicrobiota bacterium]MCH8510338.1 hypothetical protein [Kiritimatiellia bacterium]
MRKFEWMICIGILYGAASTDVLDWKGGDGTWSLANEAWSSDGGPHQAWPASGEATARFGGTAGMVSVQGDVQAEGLVFTEPGYVIGLNHDGDHRLILTGNLSGEGNIRFSGGSISNHRYSNTLMAKGVRFLGGADIAFAVDLTGVNLNSSQILTVTGADTVVTYAGNWQGDGGSAFPHLFLRDGGRFVIGEDAVLDFVNDAYFTRQLWVSGDGTGENAGAIEFAEGFVADLSEGGTVDSGLGSIRLNNATVITRHTQSIPVNFRPRPGNPEGPQTNGHFVFENHPGKWIVATHPQSYAGGVWIRANVEIHTETDLTHVGVTEDDKDSSQHYRAGNAFQTNENDLIITKTGSGALILAGEQAYRPGTEMRVQAGTVRFETDPSAGYFHNPISQALSPAGPDLQLVIEENGGAVFTASASQIQSLQTEGTMEIVLGEGPGAVVAAQGVVTLGGTLHLSLAEGHAPAPGTVFTLLTADEVNGEFDNVTFGPGAHFDVEIFEDRVEAKVLEPQGNIQELLYDDFANLDNWLDLSRAVSWTSTPSAETVFQTTPDGDADHVLNLNDASRSVPGWGSDGIRTFSSLDYVFPEAIPHRTTELTIEFRARWDHLNSTEGNRIGFTLVHDYPAGGMDLTQDEKFNDFSQAWWGRPAYQLRIRSGSRTVPGSFPILMYGGGNDIEGEFEFDDVHWMPGFSSAPGGTAPGTGAPYPDNGWVTGIFSPASITYKRYRYIIKPNAQELWVNEADDGEVWTLVAQMPLPLEEDAPSSAPYYRYFEHFEGLRIYFRSAGGGSNASNVYLDYVRITVESLDDPAPPGYSDWAAANLAGIDEDGPLDDPFGHGITNLQRYALGYPIDSIPESGHRPRLMPSAQPGQVVFRFQRPEGGRGDVTYLVYISADLMANDWEIIDPVFWTLIPADSGLESVEIEIDPGDDPLFAALEVVLEDEKP